MLAASLAVTLSAWISLGMDSILYLEGDCHHRALLYKESPYDLHKPCC